MNGIDISNNNGNVSFNDVKSAGYDIVYIKATEGITYTDPKLNANYQNAKAAGLKVGFYHFMRGNDPVKEAQFFFNTIKGFTADCIPMLDIEVDSGLSKTMLSAHVNAFKAYAATQDKSICPVLGLYTYLSFYNDNLDASVRDIPLWIAQYGVSVPGISNYIGWQYSQTGTIAGNSCKFDLDSFSDKVLISSYTGGYEMKNIVVFATDIDARAAAYLADYLECPMISNAIPFDFSKIQNVYTVGAGTFTSYAKYHFQGTDRYDTCQKVLTFIKTGKM